MGDRGVDGGIILRWIFRKCDMGLWRRVLSGPKRGEVTREWRKLHNEELNDLYYSPIIVRVIKSRMRWAGLCSTYGVEERSIQGFGGET